MTSNPTEFPAHQFEFSVRPGEELTLEEAVFQALGAASTCWDDISAAGVFHSECCKDVGDKLVAWLRGQAPHEQDGPCWCGLEHHSGVAQFVGEGNPGPTGFEGQAD